MTDDRYQRPRDNDPDAPPAQAAKLETPAERIRRMLAERTRNEQRTGTFKRAISPQTAKAKAKTLDIPDCEGEFFIKPDRAKQGQ
jgi:hypothetical protein